ncbi:MAG: hypothetical protein LUQ22_04195, partial [Methanotrichaceae archaeon]|nr:hypothetical protein [Methanotrichaceae archaeon]
MSQGIFGIIDFAHGIDRQRELVEIASKVFLNEPADSRCISYASDNHYFLTMKRVCNASNLQQNDIAINNERQVICLIHGEINNSQDLLKDLSPADRNSGRDLDLLVHLYWRHGSEFVKKLNGLFSLAILDQRDSSFFLLNDRFGLAHQVYWAQIGNRFYFATHLKALLALPEFKREIDFEGLNLFLKYSYIPSPWTIFKGIQKLPPGHLLTFKKGNVEVSPYWGFPSSNNHVGD